MEESVFLTVGSVAALIGVPKGRVYDLIDAGVIPAVRLSPRRIRVPKRAFEVWIAGQSDKALASVADVVGMRHGR